MLMDATKMAGFGLLDGSETQSSYDHGGYLLFLYVVIDSTMERNHEGKIRHCLGGLPDY